MNIGLDPLGSVQLAKLINKWPQLKNGTPNQYNTYSDHLLLADGQYRPNVKD